jgi:peptide/nickel transport system substrate-binding protein
MTDLVRRFTAAELDRRNFLKFTGMLSAATALTAGLAACGGGDSSSSSSASASAAGTADRPQGTITATAGFALFGGFDPLITSSAVGTAVNQHVFEALVDLDPVSRKPYPALATDLPTASDDGLTWTATLRDGATFSDGSPVTAEDVAWSFQRIMDPANASVLAPFLTFIDGVSAQDERTVVFRLTSPFALFPQRTAVVKVVPKALTGDPAASKAFDAAPVGSGPFKVDSADATSGVVMSDNEAYNGPRPALVTKIVLNTSIDNAARLNDLQGGQSQAIEAVPYLDAASLDGQFQVDEKQAFNMMYMLFNCSAPPFDDKRVRQALLYAIDIDKVIATALSGYGTAATGYLDEANPGFQKPETVFEHDPAKAKALLEEAGVSDLSFEFVTTNVGFIADSAPVILDGWKQIGVNATLNTAPTSSVLSELVPAPGFRVLAGSGDPTVFGTDTDLLLRWYYYGPTWLTNRARWTTPEFDQLQQLIDTAAGQEGEEQEKTWKQAFDLIAEEVPLYPVFHTKTVTASDPGELVDFEGAPTTGLYFLGVGTTS